MESTNIDNVTGPRQTLEQIEAALFSSLGPLPSQLESSSINLPMRDGHLNPLKIIRPATTDKDAASPVILLFHGGGFMAGSALQLERPAREYALNFHAVVMLGDYRFAPDNPFPKSVEDVVDTLMWVDRNAEEMILQVDLAKGFVVGGYSAGGNLAGIATLLAGELYATGKPVGTEMRHKVTGSFISIPLLSVEENVPDRFKDMWVSREENRDSEPVNTRGYEVILENLRPDVKSKLWSPMNWNTEELARVPKTYFQVSEKDPVRDDARIYEQMLREAGVETKLDSFEGGHGAFTVFAQEGNDNFEEMRTRTLDAMRWLLNSGT